MVAKAPRRVAARPDPAAGDFLAFASIREAVAKGLTDALGPAGRLPEQRIEVPTMIARMPPNRGPVDDKEVSAQLAGEVGCATDGQVPR